MRSFNQKYNGWNNYETWRVNLECFDGWQGRLEAEEAREMIEEIASKKIAKKDLVATIPWLLFQM